MNTTEAISAKIMSRYLFPRFFYFLAQIKIWFERFNEKIKNMKGYWAKNFSLLVITIILSIVLCELLVSILRADLIAIRPLLYLVEGDYTYEGEAKIMETTDNPHIIYRIRNTGEVRCTNCIHPKEKSRKFISYRFSGSHSRLVKSSQQAQGDEKIFIIGGKLYLWSQYYRRIDGAQYDTGIFK